VPDPETPVGSGVLLVSIETAPPVAGSTVFAPLNVNVPPSTGTLNNSLSLDLLDVSVVQRSPNYPPRCDRLESIPDPGGVRRSHATAPDGKPASHQAESQIADPRAQADSRSKQACSALLPSGVGLLARVPLEGRPESTVDREPRINATQRDDHMGWMARVNPLIVAVSIPLMCSLCRDPGPRYVRDLGKVSRLTIAGWEEHCSEG
jgi:hypothetical protein